MTKPIPRAIFWCPMLLPSRSYRTEKMNVVPSRKLLFWVALFMSLLLPASTALLAQKVASPGRFAWRIEGAKGPVYLLGTIHLEISAVKDLDPEIWDGFERSSAFVMEVDPRTMTPEQVLKLALLPPGKGLDAMLGPSSWRKLVEQLGDNYPERLLRRSRPWFVTTLMLAKNNSRAKAMDRELFEAAEAAGKQLFFLETITEQAEVMDTALTLETLVEAIENPRELIDQFNSIVAAYRAGDHAALVEAIFREEKVKPRQFEILFYQRNRNWLPKIEKHIQQGNAFIAVGVGHLLRDNGILTLLQRKGYRVTQVGAEQSQTVHQLSRHTIPQPSIGSLMGLGPTFIRLQSAGEVIFE